MKRAQLSFILRKFKDEFLLKIFSSLSRMMKFRIDSNSQAIECQSMIYTCSHNESINYLWGCEIYLQRAMGSLAYGLRTPHECVPNIMVAPPKFTYDESITTTVYNSIVSTKRIFHKNFITFFKIYLQSVANAAAIISWDNNSKSPMERGMKFPTQIFKSK